MPDDMLRFCIDLARTTLGKVADWQAEGDAAVQSIKDALDAQYGSVWHVVCGKHFGSKVTHDAKHYTFFYVGDKAVLLFKLG
jgi:dynein light chain LC8-type